MMIVMLKMRVYSLGDFCVIFYRFLGVFEMCHFWLFLIAKTQCLRESGFKSYVFYCCDVQKQANGLRGSDAHHSQVRSLPTKV